MPVDAVDELVLAAVGERTDVQAPRRYVVTAGTPADPTSDAAWRAQEEVAGRGRRVRLAC